MNPRSLEVHITFVVNYFAGTRLKNITVWDFRASAEERVSSSMSCMLEKKLKKSLYGKKKESFKRKYIENMLCVKPADSWGVRLGAGEGQRLKRLEPGALPVRPLAGGSRGEMSAARTPRLQHPGIWESEECWVCAVRWPTSA